MPKYLEYLALYQFLNPSKSYLFFLFPLEIAAVAFPLRTRVFCSTRVWEYVFHYPISHNIRGQEYERHNDTTGVSPQLWCSVTEGITTGISLCLIASGKLRFVSVGLCLLTCLNFPHPSIKKRLRKQLFEKGLLVFLHSWLLSSFAASSATVWWSQSE